LTVHAAIVPHTAEKSAYVELRGEYIEEDELVEVPPAESASAKSSSPNTTDVSRPSARRWCRPARPGW
jgi:hypothetical protein